MSFGRGLHSVCTSILGKAQDHFWICRIRDNLLLSFFYFVLFVHASLFLIWAIGLRLIVSKCLL